MRKAGLDESPVGIKIAGRNINNLRYADDTTLMAESEEELKSLLMWVKEESAKAGLKLNIKKTKIMASGPLTSWQIDGEEMESGMIHQLAFRKKKRAAPRLKAFDPCEQRGETRSSRGSSTAMAAGLGNRRESRREEWSGTVGKNGNF
ncbi:putative uncharacterized transposon-derived protein F52C9.6 [Varanus komodoensis]|nr:putative uncharacterized transposon-derived protein F52C9.6 [Varanus komodoensis]